MIPVTSRAPALLTLIVTLVLATITAPSFLSAQTAPEFLRRGEDALREGVQRYDENLLVEAADALRRALDRNPRFAIARVRLAEALMWLNDYEQARRQIQLARELPYRDVDLDLLEARLMVLTDRDDEALRLYDEILRQRPYNPEAQISRAVLALGRGMTDGTVRRLRILEQRYPENRQLLTALVETAAIRGDREAERRYLATALQYHGDVPSIQLVAARRALEQGDAQRAEYHARNAVGLAPLAEEGWLVLARAAHLQGNSDQARQHYEQLISLDPENHRAWYARGVLAEATDDVATAYRSWDRALRIRPDYELARIARENTLIRREPLDSARRAEAAVAYRSSGRELEERFLHRQAERHYRRGLQISPFDTDLRRGLADLYRSQDLRGRYLQELEIIADLGAADREIEELIETFRGLRRDAPAVRWGVDQFTASRFRTGIAVFHQQGRGTFEPDASRHLAEYIASLLRTSQDISVISVEEGAGDRIQTVARAREGNADLIAILNADFSEERVHLALEVLDRRTAEPVLVQTLIREGIGRVERTARDAAHHVAGLIQPVGMVVDRRFDRVLVSIGTVDRLDEDDIVQLQREPRGDPLGTATVTAVDDLLAELRFTPDGPDRVTTGTYARLLEEPEDSPTGRNDLPPLEDEQTSRLGEIVKQLFQVR
jgi:tetratricopeptide (TPR) repeat protein